MSTQDLADLALPGLSPFSTWGAGADLALDDPDWFHPPPEVTGNMGNNRPSTKDQLLNAFKEVLEPGALDTVQLKEVTAPKEPPAKVNTVSMCITQNSIPTALTGGGFELVVGSQSEVPRWVPGSVIRWAAWRAGFENQDDADHATTELHRATEAWNQANIGVYFEWVPLAKDATFVLCHGGAKGPVMASSFFPNSNDLNYLFVYTMGLETTHRHSLGLVFLHELGHVLGLTHEFAVSKGGHRAKRLDLPGHTSVMNYHTELPELQESDIRCALNFYGLSHDANGNPPKLGLTQIVDYTPM